MYATTNSIDTNTFYIYRPTQDSNAIIYGVSRIINDVGIRVAPLRGDNGLKPGEIGFLIPQKSY
jgi:hypothetical protein